MRTAVHGMSRLGEHRALKWALEAFWAARADATELERTAAAIRTTNWLRLEHAGIDFVPSNDFSLYDHVLDAAVAVGAVPDRFGPVRGGADTPLDLIRYFAMARGGDLDGAAVAPLGLTKWFDTNYHHLVPEVGPGTVFVPNAAKAVGELTESAQLGVSTTPVLLGPFTFLLRSAPDAGGSHPLGRLDALADVYLELLAALAANGAPWIRLDEPALVEDRSQEELAAFRRAYRRLGAAAMRPRLAVSTYFGHVGDAMPVLCDLPVEGIGLDFCAGPENLDLLAAAGGLGGRTLFAGVVDGRNVWANDLSATLDVLDRLATHCGGLVVSSSCSFLHVPASVSVEVGLAPEIRPWLAFASEKVVELTVLARGAEEGRAAVADALAANGDAMATRRRSSLVADPAVRHAMSAAPNDPRRRLPGPERWPLQQARLGLPVLPTTTIGSFPQTGELRATRAAWRAGRMSDDDHRRALEAEIDRVIALQEDLGLDVLVHGEPERDDMVRYFAAQLAGFVVPEEGWVQSYGSRCVRPPILFGDVSRPAPITVEWATYAQSRTSRPVKAMLTGPVTMLRWSFVRDDQPPSETACQLGLAVGHEVADLQAAGIAVVQVDEPGLREGMPLRHAGRPDYVAWATRAFRLATAAAGPTTQVHTHMCYAELSDVVDLLDDLEVDVVSFEAARSHMALLAALGRATYQGGAGPGIYDVHSPVVPTAGEIDTLLRRAIGTVGTNRLWVNPDCGLKTRDYDEVTATLAHMVVAARNLRAGLGHGRARQEPGSVG